MPVAVHPLTPARRADFYRFHCPANDAGWCFCVAWWTPTWDGWTERTADDNRALRERLFADGHLDGYLAYDGEAVAGWCQVGPRDRLRKLARQYALAPDPRAWAITCFNVAPSRRRAGVARALLHGVLADLRAKGVARVEAFPRRGPDLDAGALWTGPERLYREAGFVPVRDDASRPVLVFTTPKTTPAA